MQETALNPHGINALFNTVSLLLGGGVFGGVLGALITSLFNRREQKARTEKIRVEIVGEQIDHYKGFSEAMRLMREDVEAVENKLRQMKKDKEQVERELGCALAELTRANETIEQYISLAKRER